MPIARPRPWSGPPCAAGRSAAAADVRADSGSRRRAGRFAGDPAFRMRLPRLSPTAARVAAADHPGLAFQTASAPSMNERCRLAYPTFPKRLRISVRLLPERRCRERSDVTFGFRLASGWLPAGFRPAFVEPWRARRAVLGWSCLTKTHLTRQPTGFQAPVQHRAGGPGRKSSISRRIFWNRSWGTATTELGRVSASDLAREAELSFAQRGLGLRSFNRP